MKNYELMVFATDLGEHSVETAHRAKQMADVQGARLMLLHVVESVPVYGYSYYAVDIDAKLQEAAKGDLEKLGAELEIPVADQKILIGAPKLEIVRYAEEVKADLIILGSHGHRGIMRLLGSTADAVVQDAKCDVLTVRHKA